MLSLFVFLVDFVHCVVMNNLYNSMEFSKEMYNHEKVLVCDAIRKGDDGVSNFVI